jgi:uncharacterized protein YkwD
MKITKKAATAVLCAVFMLCVGTSLGQSDEEMEIFRLVNGERAKQRLQPLHWDDRVARVARDHSKQMARGGFFAHQDREGKTVVDRASDRRLNGWSRIGENLFMCDETEGFERFSVRGWLKSPSHRKNMLNREWTTTGIGVFRARDGRIYVTQVFIS